MNSFNKKINVTGVTEPVGTGWLPPIPDLRDYTESHEKIKVFNQKLKLTKGKQKQASSVDLREWCSPVENQLTLGSCTAHAGIGVVEYFEKRAFGKHKEGSRLFLYKTTRNLMQETGDKGAWLRNEMGALILCGVPEEKYWPYKIEGQRKLRTSADIVCYVRRSRMSKKAEGGRKKAQSGERRAQIGKKMGWIETGQFGI